jgi:hypothetical protein
MDETKVRFVKFGEGNYTVFSGNTKIGYVSRYSVYRNYVAWKVKDANGNTLGSDVSRAKAVKKFLQAQ